MGWVKLDDGFFRHRKVVDLSKDAKLLFLAGLTYAAEQLTDGTLSKGAVKLVAGMYAGVPERTAKELLDAGLWLQGCDGGFEIHDYLMFNPTADQERRRRETTRARVERFRAKRNGEGNGVTSVGETLLPSPSSSPRELVGGEGPPPLVSGCAEEEDQILQAAHRIAERRLALRSSSKEPIVDVDRYLETVALERARHHHETALDHLQADPGLTPAGLADLLEPELAPSTATYFDPDCTDCGGSTFVVDDDAGGAVPCPKCRPFEAVTPQP